MPLIIFISGCAKDPNAKIARQSLRNINTPFTASAFEKAIIDGDIEKVNLFIQGKMSLANTQTVQPLIAATVSNKKKIVETLLANGAEPDSKSEYGTPLCIACSKGYIDIAKILLKAGADPDYIQGTINPVINAASTGNIKILKILIDEGADVDAEGEQSQFTPLILATKNGHSEIVKLLINEGADTEAVDYSGKTALDHAILAKREKCAKLLLQNDVYEISDHSIESLANAISLNELNIADLLIKQNIDINEFHGDMPILSWAIYNNYFDGADLLIKSGADLSKADNNKRIPLDYALMKHNQKLIDEIKLNMNSANSKVKN